MPKLRLKRTPDEEAAHQWRKKQRRERKWQRHSSSSADPEPGPSHRPDVDEIRAQLEEERFREKMAMAFEDDERLDSVETRFNDFAHVPKRWGGGGGGGGGSHARFEEDDDGHFMRLDPRTMDEEEYIEWVRAGMYRKTHAKEFEEKQRRREERAARKAREKALRAETERLEQAEKEGRRRRKREKEEDRLDEARDRYHMRWKDISLSDSGSLSFGDIPWPILAAHRHSRDSERVVLTVEEFTPDAISSFLFSSSIERKDRLRETFLRFHPDKFEGRIMDKVRPEERELVRSGLGQVVRILNELSAT